ncbi:hypothetical protein [Hymenobacter lucidus]|uniref:Uncharacterized protein n=1 Tax=Hymenobacter lucidus TaxID=2880930 RepID=A0ABS8AUS3_9BACT|nr:hypothetical protein [Hymenobacter lucidus]MCB2408797.1 hypothetical protein [Hymenobacter lucidus]
MKTFFLFRAPLLLFFLLLSTLAQAQTTAARLPQGGYWNVETNLATRDYTIIRFYNNQDQLIYEEKLPNLCLDLSRGTSLCRRTIGQLNGALQQVLHDPATASQTTTLLAGQLGQNRRVQRVYAVR